LFNKVDAYSKNDGKEVDPLKDMNDQVGYNPLTITSDLRLLKV
jgi:hypothetical protein